MVEGEHYISIKKDLSNLEEKILWCQKNDETCKQIAQNALEFYNTHLSKEGTYEYFDSVLSELSQIRKEPEIIKNKNHLSLIVAYRDPGDDSRKTQLNIFIQQMNAIFQKRTNLHIYIIEQESERDDYDELHPLLQQSNSRMAKFNLGRLKNIGFQLASEKFGDLENSYYILSDIDLIPSHDLIHSYLEYPNDVIHLGNQGTRYNLSGTDKNFLGGVISLNKKDFIKCNGFPNNFWGWGGEDNVLQKRLKRKKINILKPKHSVIDLEEKTIDEKMEHLKKDKLKEMRKIEKVKEDKKIWKTNGLSNLNDSYEVIHESKYHDLENVDHLIVKLLIGENDIID